MTAKRAVLPGQEDARTVEAPGAAVAQAWNGVAPIQQARSEATFHALIRAGREVVETRGFEGMTIAGLAEAAGVSVGAFYGRFENKQAYLSAIQEIAVAEVAASVRRTFDEADRQGADAHGFLEVVARTWVAIFRENRGLYLGAFKDSTTRPGAWTPFKQLGWNMAALVVERLLPRLQALGKNDTEREVRIALQFVNGLLVNATINDPGPIRLGDPEMEINIARFLCSFFGLESPRNHGKSARSRKGTK